MNTDIVIYNGHKCRILKIWENFYYDLQTLQKTEKFIIETYLSIPKTDIILVEKQHKED